MSSVPILTIENFKGKPPIGAYQSAYMVAQYDFVIKETRIDVECWMRQDLSWINWDHSQLSDKEILNHLLIHEQGHFNIAILFSKRLKHEAGDIDMSKPNIEVPRLEQIKGKLATELNSMNDGYETETKNGRDKEKQFQWNGFINDELSKVCDIEVKVTFK